MTTKQRGLAPIATPGPAFARAVLAAGAVPNIAPGRYIVTVDSTGGVSVRWETQTKATPRSAVVSTPHVVSLDPASPSAFNLRGIITALREGWVR